MQSRLLQAFSAVAIALAVLTDCVENAFVPGAPFWSPKQNPYPTVKQVPFTRTYRSANAKGNVTFNDPYTYLEATGSADVQKFINDQSKLTEGYMAKCKNRQAIEQSIKNGFDYDNYNYFDLIANAAKPFYTYTLKRVNDDRPIWYIATLEEIEVAKKNNFATPPGKQFLNEVFLSPNNTANIINWQTSPDGKYFAYLVSDSGSQVSTWFIRTFDKTLLKGGSSTPLGGGDTLPDVIPNADGTIFWTDDSKGFFYTGTLPSDAGESTNFGSSVRYHVLGTAYEKDITIAKAEKPMADGSNNLWNFFISSDSKWLVLNGANGSLNKARMYATRLDGQTVSGNMKWISIAPGYDYIINPLNVIDDTLYVQTYEGALDGRIAKTKLDWSKAKTVTDFTQLKDKLALTTVVPEVKKAQLTLASAFNSDKLVIIYTMDGTYVTKVFELKTGKLIRQVVPDEHPGAISIMIPASKGKSFKLILNTLSCPNKVYDITLDGNKYTETNWLTKSIKGTNANDFVTETAFATSKDGTKVPYIVVSKKGTPKDGQSAAWMHVFGAYGVTQNNYYDPVLFSWLNSYGGFFIFASVRGGGDCGEEWHIAGQKHNKQKTFEDTIAVANDLVKQKYAAPGKVIADGGAAGAIAIAAAANQSPSSFGVLLGVRPVLDYFLRKRTRGGAEQIDEFGDVDNPVDFDYVRAWSPLQNIPTKGDYPAVLMTPGEGDDQVVPAHSYKFLAQAQHDHPNNPLPLLQYVVPGAGLDNFGSSTQSTMIEGGHQICVAELALGLQRKK
ncbi:prolyl oligopeptidase [Meira miltonrushii]|uniref:Prolyl endopeptidase n=1 Tax=Meira miltonrushii TaxID=1280837 RepID=A0A316VFB1_9BASI|nr:prolyl oligopeptidase [Meira miltonrushii]PWN35003.1 prolyl oligopeptidase [Meira miltonrushii]